MALEDKAKKGLEEISKEEKARQSRINHIHQMTRNLLGERVEVSPLSTLLYVKDLKLSRRVLEISIQFNKIPSQIRVCHEDPDYAHEAYSLQREYKSGGEDFGVREYVPGKRKSQ